MDFTMSKNGSMKKDDSGMLEVRWGVVEVCRHAILNCVKVEVLSLSWTMSSMRHFSATQESILCRRVGVK